MEEKELIRRSKAGDRDAFGELYDAYLRQIYAFVFYKTHNKQIAEDIVSETFLKALKNINTVDPDKSFAGWLYIISKNTIRDYYRAKSSAPHLNIDDAWDLSDEIDTSKEAEQKFLQASVGKYLRILAPRERDIIIMRVWQELSYQEIADILQTSEAGSKMAYSRALGKLRRVMPKGIAIALLALHGIN
jgi:RNA polymerase sigma-70 factor (ECF subfamily)